MWLFAMNPSYFKQHSKIVFTLALCENHTNFSAFTHVKHRPFFSDIKTKNQNCQKIGSVVSKGGFRGGKGTGPCPPPQSAKISKHMQCL